MEGNRSDIERHDTSALSGLQHVNNTWEWVLTNWILRSSLGLANHHFKYAHFKIAPAYWLALNTWKVLVDLWPHAMVASFSSFKF